MAETWTNNKKIKKGNKKKNGRKANFSSSIHGLVESITQHKKFKQLAAYSIGCVTKLVDRKFAGNWAVNAQECIKCGISQVTDPPA